MKLNKYVVLENKYNMSKEVPNAPEEGEVVNKGDNLPPWHDTFSVPDIKWQTMVCMFADDTLSMDDGNWEIVDGHTQHTTRYQVVNKQLNGIFVRYYPNRVIQTIGIYQHGIGCVACYNEKGLLTYHGYMKDGKPYHHGTKYLHHNTDTVDQKCLVVDTRGENLIATIKQVGDNRIHIMYDMWSEKWDEWLDKTSPRLLRYNNPLCTYTGSWEDGHRSKGKMVYRNDSVYEGTFDQDGFCQGKFTAHDGTVVEGHFKYYRPHGQVTLTCANGNIFNGQYEHGAKHQGVLTYANGDVFDGNFNPMHGKLTRVNGDVYEGYFKHDKYHGEGMLIKANGDIFEGSFEHGNMVYGKLTKTANGGDVYEGKFADNQLVEGRITYANGLVYDGKCVDNKKHDRQGMLTFADGWKYQGNFENDVIVDSDHGRLLNRYNGVICQGRFLHRLNGQSLADPNVRRLLYKDKCIIL